MSVYHKHRRPYPRQRKPARTVFTPGLWSSWLKEQPWAKPRDKTTQRLRAGIAEFRQLANKEMRP
jgi:hypothetical protein